MPTSPVDFSSDAPTNGPSVECSHRRLSFPLSEWMCLLPGSNIYGPFHLEAFLPRMITEIHISLKETIEQ